MSGAKTYNLGNGNGFSVQQVIDTAKKVVSIEGKSIEVEEGSRRLGDPAVLVADSTLARQELSWKPNYCDLENIILHAWEWEKKMPNLYGW